MTVLITGGRASLCLPYPMGLGVHAGEKAAVQMVLTRKHSLVFLGDVRSFMRWGDSEKRKQTLLKAAPKAAPGAAYLV